MPAENSGPVADGAVTGVPPKRKTGRRAVRPGRKGGRALERITVNVTRRASRALEVATGLTGDSKTDTVNRALQVYAYMEQVTAEGGSVYVREAAGAELELLKLF